MRKEAEELEKLQQQYLQERARLDNIKQAEAAQLMKENLQQINDVKRMKEIEKLQDEVCDMYDYFSFCVPFNYVSKVVLLGN